MMPRSLYLTQPWASFSPSNSLKDDMKKIIFIPILIGSISQLWGQKKVQFFLAPSFTIGANRSPASIEFSQYTGWVTDKQYFTPFENGKNLVPHQVGGKLDIGLSFQERLFVFTGLAYTIRKEAVYPRCDVCDLILPDKPLRITTEFWEIPLGVKLLLLKETKVNPFIGSTLFYTFGNPDTGSGLTGQNPNYSSIGYRFSTGVSIALPKAFSLQLAAQVQNNFHPDNRFPIYRFAEMGIELGFVKIFGRP